MKIMNNTSRNCLRQPETHFNWKKDHFMKQNYFALVKEQDHTTESIIW